MGLLVGAPVEGAVIGGARAVRAGALTDRNQVEMIDPA
jgi:hypothetical protein